jgi:hypothetical protein
VSDTANDLDHLKTRIDHDEYAVDPRAVAAAILAMLSGAAPRDGGARQSRACS